MKLAHSEPLIVFFDPETETISSVALSDGMEITEELSPWLIFHLEKLALRSYWEDMDSGQTK